MLSLWTTESDEHFAVIKNHLQEILRQADQGAHVIIKYVQVQVGKIINLLRTLQQAKYDEYGSTSSVGSPKAI